MKGFKFFLELMGGVFILLIAIVVVNRAYGENVLEYTAAETESDVVSDDDGVGSTGVASIVDVSALMEQQSDSVFVDSEELEAIRQTEAYTGTMNTLGAMGMYGTRCTHSYTHAGIQSYTFDVLNTDLSFYISIYTDEALKDSGIDAEKDTNDNGELWSECYVDALNAYVVADGVRHTVSAKASWIRFDKGIPSNSNRIYKAVALAGIEGQFATDYESEGIHSPMINLYDLETGKLLHSIKFESED